MQYSITNCLNHPAEDTAMTTLTVTARGQVTFRKQVLQHLGIKPGEKIELGLLPDGRAELRAMQQKGSLRELAGFLKSKTNGNVLTIKEIDDVIADASAAAGAGEA
jgi:bifunctional DNA-binding transcriptional regulator/antitoxin component of YhaV-PrlF toxin-antitoxin module